MTLLKFCCTFLGIVLLFFSKPSFANNLQVSVLNFSPSERRVELRLTWENAWYETNGWHDAVWLFGKAKQGTQWQSIVFDTSPTSLRYDPSVEASTRPDGLGILLKSRQNGDMSTTLSCVLHSDWNDDTHLLAFMALSMVYVPEGSFWLGDGVGSQNAFRTGTFAQDSTKVLPYLVASEAQIRVGLQSDALFGRNDLDWTPPRSIPETFPKGYKAFYAMKYEITQAQYADFLNTLSYSEQALRMSAKPDAGVGEYVFGALAEQHRNTLRIQHNGQAEWQRPAYIEAGLGALRACNFLNANDLLAYLDWAGLRPLSELEFEKACRGFAESQRGEMVWGSTEAQDANSPVQDAETNETVREKATSEYGLASFHSGLSIAQLQGPLRVGFGGSSTSNRLQAGASFFGLREMSGNLWELCASPNDKGLGFLPQNGNGRLQKGEADAWSIGEAADWLRWRGGSWNSFMYEVGSFRDLSISARFYANLRPAERRPSAGGRGALSWEN